jgi:sporulation protein YlmC with PRC-barrel domain
MAGWVTAALLAGAVSFASAQVFRPADLELLRASEILGREVHDARGARLGAIRDLVIDRRTGKVEYLALDQGVFPVSALRSGEGTQLLLDIADAGGASAGGTAPGAYVRASELLQWDYDDLLISPDGELRFALSSGSRVSPSLR